MGSLLGNAQDYVKFAFSDGLNNEALINRMEREISMFLSAINSAESKGVNIDYVGINVDEAVKRDLDRLWSTVYFRIDGDDILERCIQLKTNSGEVVFYQVRNIPILMKPFEGDDSFQDELYQEAVLNFSKEGKIISFRTALPNNQYVKLFREGTQLDNIYHKTMILDFTERFRAAYNNRDIEFMETIFSNDALIITGKELKRAEGPKYEYTVQDKQQYLSRLQTVFKRNSYINVNFDISDEDIVRHGAKPNIYGLTLKQDWSTNTYSDEGIVFLIWDFTDEDNPRILVRTWQPMSVGKEEIFTLQKIELE